jgi:hypothetical protein
VAVRVTMKPDSKHGLHDTTHYTAQQVKREGNVVTLLCVTPECGGYDFPRLSKVTLNMADIQSIQES